MSADPRRNTGVVFFDSQRIVEPAPRRWPAIVAVLLVFASLMAAGLWAWRFLPSP